MHSMESSWIWNIPYRFPLFRQWCRRRRGRRLRRLRRPRPTETLGKTFWKIMSVCAFVRLTTMIEDGRFLYSCKRSLSLGRGHACKVRAYRFLFQLSQYRKPCDFLFRALEIEMILFVRFCSVCLLYTCWSNKGRMLLELKMYPKDTIEMLGSRKNTISLTGDFIWSTVCSKFDK